eukprot:CAMPEP_0117420806 /NCGR_PEP_ID=MMETSP0758-20121206/2069_1 /TAXON_ID=63605 /ORGANISM="Percolomonas cosmopolitus, Strain AE-1 (ATCC 50343)" /LENGTH=424 /DNA_ID=CAMNT_0005202641 /DNA_START=2490 /DNA_END=3764 /DNA_ORIENTATION=-
MTHLKETLSGLTTIRAFKKEGYMMEELQLLLKRHLQTFYTVRVAKAYYNIRVQFLSSSIVWMTAILCILLKVHAVTFSLILSRSIEIGIDLVVYSKLLSEFREAFVSVERIQEYFGLEAEGDRHERKKFMDDGSASDTTDWDDIVPSSMPSSLAKTFLNRKIIKVPPTWPSKGRIRFSKVYLSYEKNINVLHNINLEIRPHDYVGIVGRTGSGKSTLIAALFRLQELKYGSIFIDQYDIQTIPLGRLRDSMALVPQEATLLFPTIRENIDPNDDYSDDAIYQVLQKVKMKQKVDEFPNKLSTLVAEHEFSAGEMQLLCLARVILSQKKIIVLDEVTSQLDHDTDKVIIDVIQNELASNCTVLSIVHRLDNLMQYDKMIVISDGQLVEEGTPSELLSNPRSHLSILKGNKMDEPKDCIRLKPLTF